MLRITVREYPLLDSCAGCEVNFNLEMKVLYPGTFDPPTNGHLNIITRSSDIFDEVVIAIANNPLKSCFFSPDERLEMLDKLVEDMKNVKPYIWSGLVVDFAAKMKINVILRGVRPLADFDHEFELSILYKSLNSNIETIFLPTDKKYFLLRSSTIKELAMLECDISEMVPKLVSEALQKKLLKMK